MSSTRCVLIAGCVGLAASAAFAQSSDEVRAVVAEMLAEAQGRSSLLAGGTGGHDGMFYLASDDGDFRLNVNGIVQFRYLADFRDDDNTIGSNPGDDFDSGFQMRRVKLGFNGKIHKDWSYAVLANFARSGGTLGLQDAYTEYAINDQVERMGQSKVPLLREELVPDQRQLTVERSLVNAAFTQDRSKLVQLSYEAAPISVRAAFSDGINSDNTDFNAGENSSFIIGGKADWAATGRDGSSISWRARRSSSPTSPPSRAGPSAPCWARRSTTSRAPTRATSPTWTGTPSSTPSTCRWKAPGGTSTAPSSGATTTSRAAGGHTEFDDFAVVVQGGFRLGPKWEPFARYEGFFFDSDRGFSDDTHNFLTVGVNHYIAGHALKFTGDVVIPFEDTADLVATGILPDTGVGLLGSSKDGEVVVRLQFQLLF